MKEVIDQQRQEYVKKLFSMIATDYDRLNNIISFYLHHRWRRLAIEKADLKETDYVLDLGVGTGDFAIEATRMTKNGKVIGIDFCHEMLEIGQKKIKKLGLEHRIELKECPALPIPFKDETFDCVIMGFLLRHVEIPQIFEEIFRILKPCGRVVALETGQPRYLIINKVHYLYFYKILPLLGKLFHGDSIPYKYLPESMEKYLPTQQELKKIMEKQGFKKVGCFDILFGAATIYLGFK